jgi:hypothetical protein
VLPPGRDSQEDKGAVSEYNGSSRNDRAAMMIETRQKDAMRFEADCVEIKVDSCCTRTMSPDLRDLVQGTLRTTHNKAVKRFGGSLTKIKQQGTILSVIADDDERSWELLIPNLYYVPKSEVRLLSPQHWAQQVRDHYPQRRGTLCATYYDETTHHWNQQRSKRTIKINTDTSNVATVWTVRGYMKYISFTVEVDENYLQTLACSSEQSYADISPKIITNNIDRNDASVAPTLQPRASEKNPGNGSRRNSS